MFETNTFKMQQNFSLTGSYQGAGAAPEVSQSVSLYNKVSVLGQLSRLWERVSGRNRHLLTLAEVEKSLNVRSRHRLAGVQPVLIRQIRGTEGRSEDFDGRFNPLNERSKSRWLSIATARKLGVPMPPVELIQVGEIYFVRDGHHRISVALAFGEEAIDAEVTVWEASGPLPWETSRPGHGLQAATA
jgi:hypothetical protein